MEAKIDDGGQDLDYAVPCACEQCSSALLAVREFSQCGKNRNLRTHVSRLPSEIPSYRNFVPAEVVVTLLQSLWRKVMQGGSDMDAVTPG
jgi:hypothetical protein